MRRKFLICTGATLAYWLVMFLGPALILLLNDVGYLLSGTGWEKESIMYNVLSFFKQPLACWLAYAVIQSICGDEQKKCVLFNCMGGAFLCAMFTLSTDDLAQLFAMAISAIVCLCAVISQSRSMQPKTEADT